MSNLLRTTWHFTNQFWTEPHVLMKIYLQIMYSLGSFMYQYYLVVSSLNLVFWYVDSACNVCIQWLVVFLMLSMPSCWFIIDGLFWYYLSNSISKVIWSCASIFLCGCMCVMYYVYSGWVVAIPRMQSVICLPSLLTTIDLTTQLGLQPKYFVWNNQSSRKWGLWWESGSNL